MKRNQCHYDFVQLSVSVENFTFLTSFLNQKAAFENKITVEEKLFALDDRLGITELEGKLPFEECHDEYEDFEFSDKRVEEIESQIDSVLEQNRDVYDSLDSEMEEKFDSLVDADEEEYETIVAEIEALEERYAEADEATGLDKLFYELGRLWYGFFG